MPLDERARGRDPNVGKKSTCPLLHSERDPKVDGRGPRAAREQGRGQ
jgi:hypothetical protein